MTGVSRLLESCPAQPDIIQRGRNRACDRWPPRACGPVFGPIPERARRPSEHSGVGATAPRWHRAPEPTNPSPATTARIRETVISSQRRRIGLRADGSSAERTRRAPEPTFRFLKSADESLPQASSTPTRPAGRWSRRAACRSCRVPRRANDSSSEGPGRQPQQAVGVAERIPPDAELPGATTEGTARQPNRRIEARAGNSPAARTVRSRERRSAGRSDDLHARNGRFTWRSRQFSSSPCRFTVPDHPSTMRSFNPIITRRRRAAPAYARGSIGPACARIFIEHAMFRAAAPGSVLQYCLASGLSRARLWHT